MKQAIVKLVLALLFSQAFVMNACGQSNATSLKESINGEWLFFWSELIKKPESALHEPLITQIPHEWPDLKNNGVNLPKIGYGTYFKQLILPKKHPDFGIEIPHFYSAYKLIVNGQVLYECGVVARTKEDYEPKRVPKVISFGQIKADTLNIAIQVANFDHTKSGFLERIGIGEYDDLNNKFTRRLSFNLFVAGGLFISGIIVLIFSVYHKQLIDQVPFYGLFSMSIMYHLLGSDSYPLHVMFPEYDYKLALHLEYLTTYAASFSSGLFVFTVYKRQSKPWVAWLFYIITGLCVLIVLFCPSLIFTEVLDYYLYFFFVYVLLYFGIMIWAKIKDNFSPLAVSIALVLIFFWSLLEIVRHLGWYETPLVLHTLVMGVIVIFCNFSMLGTFVTKINKVKLSKAELGYQKSRQTMLSLISHEIKMPVATLQMNMEMIKRASERPEKFEKVKDKIVNLSLNAVETIKRMLHDFIYFMSLNQVTNDELSFGELYEFIGENWETKLVMNKPGEFMNHKYLTDKMTLKYILNTLISNAEKFSRSEDAPVEIHLEQKKLTVVLEVRDYGVGISEEQLKRLGTEQAKIDENQEITGMGFYLAKDLAERLGHKLWVISRGTEGTSVFLSLKSV